jgi:hypothetical protein
MTKSTTRASLEQARRRREKRLARNRDRLHAANERGLCLRAAGEPLSLCAMDGSDASPLPRFSAVAYTGGPMYPKLAIAWNGPVYVDLAGLDAVATNPIHRDHDESKPIGHSVAVDNDGQRLVCSGVFSVNSDDTSEIVTSAKQGFPWRPSVGVKIVSYTTLQAGQTASINGRIVEGPALWVKRSVLKEISLVTIPGDDSATISIAATQGTPMPDFASYCASLGVDPAAASPELLQALQMAYAESIEPKLTRTPPPSPSGMDAGGYGPASPMKSGARIPPPCLTKRKSPSWQTPIRP